jgi:glycosyltransferase involved in cell wall biosynthesis
MRICLVYDCLFPHTVGGAERWYRNLAERLAGEGHDVTYVTLRQWEKGSDPGVPGVRVVEAGPRMALYTGGRRRTLPPIVFGLGVLWHLLRHGRGYDVVHTASFPYFSLLAAGALRPLGRYGLVVDWHELWTAGYWREYLGAIGGRVGWWVQALCLRIPQRAFCFAQLTARRLHEERVRGEVTVLEGEYAGSLEGSDPAPARDVVVFAGRHIPEKRAPAVVSAVAGARELVPGLRGVVFGDGPERPQVLAEIERLGAQAFVEAPGFVSSARVEDGLRHALCMLLPSKREGYGLIVVEASAAGVPSVVVREPDNASVELVEDGVNGVVAESLEELPAAIARVHAAGPQLRRSTADWFARNARRLSLDASLDVVAASYRESARS